MARVCLWHTDLERQCHRKDVHKHRCGLLSFLFRLTLGVCRSCRLSPYQAEAVELGKSPCTKAKEQSARKLAMSNW